MSIKPIDFVVFEDGKSIDSFDVRNMLTEC